MSIKDIIDQESRRNVRAECSVFTILHDLPQEDVPDLLAALRNENLTGAVIARALTAAGYRVSGQTLRRHRKGECACPEDLR